MDDRRNIEALAVQAMLEW